MPPIHVFHQLGEDFFVTHEVADGALVCLAEEGKRRFLVAPDSLLLMPGEVRLERESLWALFTLEMFSFLGWDQLCSLQALLVWVRFS